MDKQLEELLQLRRKNQRELTELYATLKQIRQLKNPDPKIIKMIEDEIANRGG